MSAHTTSQIALSGCFAERLPELSVPWKAERSPGPHIVVLNEPLAVELGLDPESLRQPEGVRFLVGDALAPDAAPVAQAYAGHQFGGYSARLGDGRALLLGELRDRDGRLRDVHLKGSGPTPFARADGRAALAPMLREYLMGESMHALGIPTTRALAVTTTGMRVPRDGELRQGAVLARIASSHLRVGSFQYARAVGGAPLVRRLADFAIERHYPSIAAVESPYLALLESVRDAQARLVAQWVLVGFVHGVMNTDNMTISGETIDYGPCAFIDRFDPRAVFSSIDHGGRYAYGAQPSIAGWNLTRFAETLLPLLSEDADEAQQLALTALQEFPQRYHAAWANGMRSKLGLAATGDAAVADTIVDALGAGLLEDLERNRIDYTQAFRALAHASRGDAEPLSALYAAGSGASGSLPGAWFEQWRALQPDAEAMDAANPIYIPRNHLVQEALDTAEEEGDLAAFHALLERVSAPFEPHVDSERYALPGGAGRFVTYCGT